jgi:hypothetical protein
MNANLRLSKPTKTKRYWLETLLIALPFIIGGFSKMNAQCIGPYYIFESIPSTALSSNVSPGLTANGWSNNLTSLSTSAAAAYSGRYAVTMNAVTRFMRSPVIANPGTFSFYWRASSASGYGFDVQYSPDGTTWTTLPGGSFLGTGTTTYALASFDLVAAGVPANSYVRVQCTQARAIFLDDFAITSSVSTENTIIVPKTGSAACTVPLVSGMTYTFYDNGGSSDTHSLSQNNTITFDPAPGEQVELTFTSFNTGATSTGDVDLGNTAPALTNYTGTTLPSPAVYLGTAADINVTFNLTTTSSATPSAGYVITVKCIPPVATCSAPTSPSVTASSVQATQANVAFTPPGSPPSNGYEYYISTSSSTPAAGAATTASGSGASSPMAMTGLTPDTTYYVWIRSYCGGTTYSAWVAAAATFTTKCSAYPVPYTEDFNGLNGPLPTCTSQDIASSYFTNITNGNLFTANEGASFFTKPVSLTAGTVYRLTFDYGTINGVADFDVAYGSTNFTPSTTNINILLNMYSGVSTLSTGVYNFTPASTGTYYAGFTFQAAGNPGSTQFNLDNINIEVETCFPPTALNESAVTATSATMNWTAPASVPSNGYQYYISTSNVQPDYSTTPSGTSTGTSVALGPLTSGTTYYVWVRSNCSGRYSVWSAVDSFTTTVVVVTTVNMSNGTTTMNCNNIYNFFDSGGSAASYVDFEDLTRIFTAGAGKQVKVVFTSFSTESGWDGLSIYDGISTAAPLKSSGLAAGFNTATCPAGSFYGTTSPGTIVSTSGSLTFHFTSDFIIVRPGWSATVTCVTSPTITSFTPSNNNCGSPAPVVITGTNFSGAGIPAITGVSFNGVPVATGDWVVNSATQITVNVVPSGITSGIISVSNAEASAYSTATYTVNLAPPVTTGLTICAGGSGTLSTPSICTGFNLTAPTISGNLTAATDPTAPRPTTSTSNSTICGFAAVTSNYVSTQFQVSATGLYNFEMSASPAFDAMGYITTGAFTAGSCATGTYVIGDDDSGVGTFPLMSVNLTAGVTYTLWTTVWSGSSTTYTGPFTWTITSPGGGSALLYSNAQMEWYTVATGGTAIGTGSPFNPVGVAGSGLANTNTAGTYNFYAGCSSNPTCRTLTTFVINPIPVAGTVSANQTICSGSSPANITLTGSTGTIQWQSSPDNATWSNIPTATATPLTSALMGTLTATRYYRAVVTTPCGTLNSAVVTVTVNPTTVAGSITPASASVCAGTNSTLLTLAGNTGTIQWQSSPDNATWTNIGGAIASTYTATNLAATTYFRAVVTSGVCPSANTTSVMITVSPATVAGSITPATTTVCAGTNSTLLTLAGYTGTIQWQSSPDNATWTNIVSATNPTYTATNLSVTTYYRAVITSGVCASQNTASVSITVNPTAVAGTVTPATTNVCAGTNSTLLTLSGSTGSIQWQSSPDNATWSNIASATNPTYTATNLATTTYFRAVLTSGVCPVVNTASVVINVSPVTVAGSITPATTTVCAGTNSTLLTLAGNTGTIQWQSSPDNATWTNIGGAITSTYTATNLATTTYYRAVVTSGFCASQNTASVSITVNPTAVAGTVTPATTNVCAGTNSTLLTLSGSTGSIQWQSSPDNATWSNIASATNPTYTATNLATTTYFRAVLTSGVCPVVNTASVVINVSPVTVAGSITPATTTVCAGTNSTLLTLAGNTGTIQWQSSPDNATWTNIGGAITSTYTATNLATTTYYRAVVTSGFCSSQNTASVVVTVNPATVAGTASSSQIICPGQPANMTLVGYTGTIQWQSSPDNAVWTNIAGATAATLPGATVGSLSSTTYFRAVVTSGICASANSNVLTITVTSAIGGSVSPASQNVCTTISDLTLAGYTGTITSWEWATNAGFTVPNAIAASASATLTAAQIGSFSGTRYYRAVITAGSCTAYSTVADITFNSTTWTGSWNNGVPNSSTAAIFASNYTAAANLSACSIQIQSGANVSVNPGVVLTVQNAVVVNSGGTLTFENTSSLIQVNNAAVNSGFVTYKRTTTGLHMFDYTYWSSPLFPQTLFGVSPATLSDKYFAFNTATNSYQQLASSTVMTPGKGYIIRAPQGYPVAPAAAIPYTAVFNGGSGDGVPNNGIINLPVVVSGANVMNLLGNPYASALVADTFLTANSSSIDGTIYLWTHNTPINSNNYTGSDYAVYNLGGGAGTSAATNTGINNAIPNGFIGAGQGFFVKAIANGTVTYNNGMRSGNNTQFYRPAGAASTPGSLEKNRVWLQLTNDLGAFKQMMVGYIETATNQRDWGFDSDMVEAGNVVNLYSIVGAEKFVLQGRALPFDESDQVPLGCKFDYAGTYEINISAFDGFFSHKGIYLEDKLLNVIHDLKSGSYSFATGVGIFDERFVLRYTDGTALGVGQQLFNENTVLVYENEAGINVNTSNVIMKSVKIFDVRGRLIAEKNDIGANEYTFVNLPETQQVLLIKVVSQDGAIVTKKLVY